MKKMRRAQLHRVRIQDLKDTKEATAKKSQLTILEVLELAIEFKRSLRIASSKHHQHFKSNFKFSFITHKKSQSEDQLSLTYLLACYYR
ncbi:hypothetical protein [Vibrio sp. 779(2023)]|uniref:hypothetical protein n=1 Tax=Vibrio sp. 779(2023) TaxID=3074712 RepID=UPI002966AFAD|nr:hypothetical protein [Vibrio sp. 779(2023)]MDW3155801.1 hypothetical protein [Vibrio sp. 779(2023)]